MIRHFAFSLLAVLFVVGCEQTQDPNPPKKTINLGTEEAPAPAPAAVTPAKPEDGPFGVGSKAPALQVSRFLQGEPVTAFEPNKIYVVEFWATWCGPCVQAMPHISEMQKKFPEVTFIGVNVWEDDDSAAEEFLKARGAQITYRIARDKIEPGAKAQTGAMATTWLEPAGVEGIPTAFVIDGKGRIAEIGHPLELDSVLPKVIDGSWDAATAKKLKAEQQLQAKKQQEAFRRIQELAQGDASEEAIKEIDELTAILPKQAHLAASFAKMQMLSTAENFSEQALAEGKKLTGADESDPRLLNAVAWGLVSPERTKPATKSLITFALEIAKKADARVNEKDGAIADTLARALFVSGDASGAIEVQKRSIALFEKEQVDPQAIKELQDRLTEYEVAAKKAAN